MRRRLWIRLALTLPAALPAAGGEPAPEAATLRLEAAPPAPAMRELMRRWQRQTRARISPVLREWDGVERAARRGPPRGLAAGCRRLDRALGDLGRDRLPVAPDPSVSLHLEETLRALAEAAESCTQGAYFLTTWRLRRAEASWRELRGRLLLYDLAP